MGAHIVSQVPTTTDYHIIGNALPETNRAAWLHGMSTDWLQGEHVVFLGPTGSGKTTLALDVLDIRDYVTVFGFKQYDDSLTAFKRRGYKQIREWPPNYNEHRTIYWLKPPADLVDLSKQRDPALLAFQRTMKSGGRCLFIDDTGYVSGQLKLQRPLATLLSQGRSSYISFVGALTQPSSFIEQVPSQVVRQVQHKILMRFDDEADIRGAAKIIGKPWQWVAEVMGSLDRHRGRNGWYSDFLAVSRGNMIIVRNGGSA